MLTFLEDAVGQSALLFSQVVAISGLLWCVWRGRVKKAKAKWAGGWVPSLAVSDLGLALFLRRALSRGFRLHLFFLMGVYGSRYQWDQLFFVRVLSEGFRLALGRSSGGAPAHSDLYQWCLYLLNRECPNMKCNKAVADFLLRGLTQLDVELLFWLNISWSEDRSVSTAQV